MDDCWSEIDGEILSCLAGYGSMAPAEIGRKLGISEGAVTSLLSILATQGKDSHLPGRIDRSGVEASDAMTCPS